MAPAAQVFSPVENRLPYLSAVGARSHLGDPQRPSPGRRAPRRRQTLPPHGGAVGYDAAKRIKGRKRHLLVDTLGLLLGVHVTPASVPERDGAQALLTGVLVWFHWLRRLWVDGGYSGPTFAHWVKSRRPKLDVEVVKRSDKLAGFKVLPRRWVVERTFGWLMHQRRLVRDYETTESSAETWIYIAMIRIQLRRLA